MRKNRWLNANADAASSTENAPDARKQSALANTARKRTAKLSTNELLNWADIASAGMMRGFEDYRHKGEIVSLDEIRLTLVSLSALTDELIIRHEVENE